MKLMCEKYTWDNSTEQKDVNFFSDVAPELTQTIDLYDYLIKDSFENIKYEFADIDEDTNALYVKASSCSFNVLALTNERSDVSLTDNLFDFFGIYSIDAFTKWRLKIYDDNNTLVYTGMIFKDGVSCSNRQSFVLEINVIGFEKEFKNYFENQTLLGTDSLLEAVLPEAISLDGLKFYSLHEVLKKNFSNVTFDFQTNLTHFVSQYYVADKPYFYAPHILFKYGLVNIRAGYDSFVLMQTDRFSWFNSICMAYGWKWFFYLDTIYIKQFIADDVTTIEIDYDDVFVEHSISNHSQQFQTDNVRIPDGGYYSNTETDNISKELLIYSDTETTHIYLGGNRNISYSVNEFSNQVRAFESLTLNPVPQSYSFNYDGWKTIINAEDWEWSFRNKLWSMYAAPFNHYTTTDRYINQTKSNTVNISPIVCSLDYGGTLDMSQPRSNSGAFYGNGNAYKINHDVGVNGFWFNGNAGHNLIKYVSNPLGYQTYEGYCMSNSFNVVMKKLTSVINHNIISVNGYGEYNNPTVSVAISNYPYENLQPEYSLDSLSFNPINKTFEMTLIA